MLLLHVMLPNMIRFFSHLFDLGINEVERVAGGLASR